MKLLLVSANQLDVPYAVYPLGISYLLSYLSLNLPHYDIQTFDFINKNYSDYRNYLNKFKPDFTAVSLRNVDNVNFLNSKSFINHYRKIVELTKQYSKSAIIVGGAGFSIFPEKIYEYINPDFGIYGEGEQSLLKLVNALENKTDYSGIPRLVYQNRNKIIINPIINKTLNTKSAKHSYKQKLIKPETQNSKLSPASLYDKSLLNYYWHHSGMLNLQTKRGCPYNCIYCTYPLIDGHTSRIIDSDKIVETLTWLYKIKKINYVFFTDSIFNINNDFNYELADKIISKKIKIKWGAYFNFTNIDEQLLKHLKKAGLKDIEFGTDSLSDTILELYKKPFRFADILRISKICNKLDINYANFLIIAGYGETKDTINETFKNSNKLHNTIFFPFVGIRIYPSTRLYDIALKEGKINKNDNLLEPKYYMSDEVDIPSLKLKAKKTKNRWVFPDEDLSKVIDKMRKKNKKGPLWEYLIH